jgi:hypothetical protein
MSQLKLETKDEIKTFFKILAEESVSLAHDDLKSLAVQRERDSHAYKSIKQEQDSPVEEEDNEFVVDADDEPAGVSVEDDEEVSVDVSTSEDVSIEDVSLDSIEDKLNDIRAGRSLKDSQVEGGMRDYFDTLSDAERLALYAFVDTLASIMTLSDEGPKDPSDPPYNVTMTTGSEESEVSVTTDYEDVGAEDEVIADDEEVVEDEIEDDRDVPIQVGGVQDITEIRKRVRELMKRQ